MSIIGRPVMNLSIDRLIRWIKTAVAVVLLVAIGAASFDQFRANQGESEQALKVSESQSDMAAASRDQSSSAGGLPVSDHGATP